MSDRAKEFNSFVGFNFSELVKIKFRAAPRNATDYYYHPKTKIIYSYYFGGDSGRWESNVQINTDNIRSPSELSTCSNKTETKKSFSIQNKNPEKILDKSEEIKILELKFKLSENYKLEIIKLEAERKLLESKIELKKLKQKRS
jgi:hypothetical protein